MELFSYFAGLVAIIAVALGLVLLWPLWALLSYLRRAWRKPVKEPEDEEAAVNAPEPAEEVGHDKP
jgi:cytochrome c-type biogenesis protein CcmH/NrfG